MSATPARRAGSVARRIIGQEPVAYAIGLLSWTTFQSLPVVAGVLLKAVLDRAQVEGVVSASPSGLIWGLLAALAGVELGRWLVLIASAWQWHGMWAFWHTVPRLAVLESLLLGGGPTTGRLPGSPGEAVSRFRDDVKNVALVGDVWLDVTATIVSVVLAFGVLLSVSPPAALVVAVPTVLALGLTRLLAARLTALRLAERTATSAVTGFIGDTFGAVTTVRGAGAEHAVVTRFSLLGDVRAQAALHDQVGTQTLQTLAGATGNLSTGLALLLLAPDLAAGAASVGDVGLFASSAIVIANLPRWVARLGAYTRQADVSVQRLAELLPPGADPIELGAPVEVDLRHGPGQLTVRPVHPPDRPAGDRLRSLTITGLIAGPVDAPVGPVDLRIDAGSVTVLTGPVGCGKTTVLRAVLGLAARHGGTIAWNDHLVEDPSTWMLPPRVAIVPQVPRLFSERLSDTVLLGVDGAGLDEALAAALLTEDIAALPAGTDTLVGPRGVRLSGGQVQRTAAARAFVRRPDLLIVDDLSSALDVTTETRLWDRLLEGDDRPAVLIVTHRQRVISAADRVVVLPPRG